MCFVRGRVEKVYTTKHIARNYVIAYKISVTYKSLFCSKVISMLRKETSLCRDMY